MDTDQRMMAAKQGRFEALLCEHAGIVIRVVRTYCRLAEDQQDLAQEIKLQLWRSFAKYDERRSFSTWMYRISLNAAISWDRRSGLRNRHAAPLSELTDRATSTEDTEDVRVLYELIEDLDPMNRALLLLYLDDLSHAEIGEILGITSLNVATKISRLKQRLRQMALESDTVPH